MNILDVELFFDSNRYKKLFEEVCIMVFRAKQWEYIRKCWHLTPREIDVAKLVCEGMSNEQIGKRLKIKYNTVRAHLGNICGKVAVTGKGGLILRFVEVLSRTKV